MLHANLPRSASPVRRFAQAVVGAVFAGVDRSGATSDADERPALR